MDFLNHSLPIIASTVVLEFAYCKWRKKPFIRLPDSLANFSLGISYLLVSALIALSLYRYYGFLFQYRLFEIPKTLWAFALLMLADDLINYWVHRLSHTTRFFWAVHETHHSSEEYNISTATRLSFMSLLTTWPFWGVLPLLGFSPEWILIQAGISHIYGIFTHTRTIQKLGILEYVLTTPSHHRVHHGSNIKYLDRNYSIMFIVWDRLFGSFQAEEEPPKFGILHPINTDNPLKIISHPWIELAKDLRAERTWKNRALLLIKPPGWKSDGSGISSEQLKRDALLAKPATPHPASSDLLPQEA